MIGELDAVHIHLLPAPRCPHLLTHPTSFAGRLADWLAIFPHLKTLPVCIGQLLLSIESTLDVDVTLILPLPEAIRYRQFLR